MCREEKSRAVAELTRIPGIGPVLADGLWGIGIRRLDDLKGSDPEDLWRRICARRGEQVCRCVLYTMRCAVYFATAKDHNPEKLKWWNWKDED